VAENAERIDVTDGRGPIRSAFSSPAPGADLRDRRLTVPAGHLVLVGRVGLEPTTKGL
jgi:hypothetical protein